MGFSYYRSITIDHTKCGSVDTSHYPLLFSTTNADLKVVGSGGKVQNSSGYDIGFYSDSALTAKLDWEVEKYVSTSGLLIAWVRVPTLSVSSDVVIYLAYGDASISTFQGNVTGTWSDGGSNYFKLVQHLPGDGSDTNTVNFTDSTANNTATNHGAKSTNLSTVGTDGGANMIASGGPFYYSVADNASLDFSASDLMTLEFLWEESVDNLATQIYLAKYQASPTVTGYQATSSFTGGNRKHSLALLGNFGSADYISVTGTGIGMGTHRAMWTYDGSGANTGVQLYIDGTLITLTRSGSLTATMANTDALFVGADHTPANNLNGLIDEVRISKGIARNASYDLASYNNQFFVSTFYVLGSEVPIISGGASARIIICG